MGVFREARESPGFAERDLGRGPEHRAEVHAALRLRGASESYPSKRLSGESVGSGCGVETSLACCVFLLFGRKTSLMKDWVAY